MGGAGVVGQRPIGMKLGGVCGPPKQGHYPQMTQMCADGGGEIGRYLEGGTVMGGAGRTRRSAPTNCGGDEAANGEDSTPRRR